GLVAGTAGVAAPFVMLGALLFLSAGVALRAPSRPGHEDGPPGRGEPRAPRPEERSPRSGERPSTERSAAD
ncbi:MFS transporter, partial [Streptomyces sp. G35A]